MCLCLSHQTCREQVTLLLRRSFGKTCEVYVTNSSNKSPKGICTRPGCIFPDALSTTGLFRQKSHSSFLFATVNQDSERSVLRDELPKARDVLQPLESSFTIAIVSRSRRTQHHTERQVCIRFTNVLRGFYAWLCFKL